MLWKRCEGSGSTYFSQIVAVAVAVAVDSVSSSNGGVEGF